jgi:hypothetical protein
MNNVYLKLVKVQNELKAPKSQYNSFGKYSYRNCEDILEALKPLLNEVKAIVNISDEIILIGERYYVKATVKFIDAETGEVVEASAMAREEETKKGMDASQLTGSTSSYARKYALNGLFAIDDTKDADTTNTHGKENVKSLSEAQLKRMYVIGKNAGYENSKVDSMINQKYNKKACDMTKEEYDNVVEGLQKIADAKAKEKFIASEKKFIKSLAED